MNLLMMLIFKFIVKMLIVSKSSAMILGFHVNVDVDVDVRVNYYCYVVLSVNWQPNFDDYDAN